jgi:hypothetical protein
VSENASASDFFVAGGTLRADAPPYVKRPADDEVFHLASAGRFCYVLTARQMGKSSLMIRTGRRLQESGICTAIVDLTKIGTRVSPEQWYLGLITRLKTQLNLHIDLNAWWQERASLSAVQRFTDFLHDVLLAEIQDPIVIFIDEIDATLNLDFPDDFFAAVRFAHNARATDPAYERLTFVLLGVATPADLITDRRRTPFNIGNRIDLRDFNHQDAQVLQRGIQVSHPGQDEAIFRRILYWTNGHPYLTRKLCLAVDESKHTTWTNERIDELVKTLFLSEEARKETNLQFVRDSINASPQRRQLLRLYRQVYDGRTVQEDERSHEQNRLKLFGLVRAERGALEVRNEIYRRAFNLDWIRASTPVDWTRRIAIMSTILVFLLAGTTSCFLYRQNQTPTMTPAPTVTPEIRRTRVPPVEPPELTGLDILGCSVTCKWSWTGTLAEDQWFDVRVGLGTPSSAGWTKETMYVASLTAGGLYSWEIAICHGEPGTGICDELTVSERGFFNYGGCGIVITDEPQGD